MRHKRSAEQSRDKSPSAKPTAAIREAVSEGGGSPERKLDVFRKAINDKLYATSKRSRWRSSASGEVAVAVAGVARALLSKRGAVTICH